MGQLLVGAVWATATRVARVPMLRLFLGFILGQELLGAAVDVTVVASGSGAGLRAADEKDSCAAVAHVRRCADVALARLLDFLQSCRSDETFQALHSRLAGHFLFQFASLCCQQRDSSQRL